MSSSRYLLESLGDVNTGFISTITVAELSVGAHLSQRKDALESTLNLLEIVETIDVDSRVAIKAGEIYASLVREGKMVELNDCMIAATAFSAGINEIVTRNLEHFERISGITAIEPENIDLE